MSCPAGVHARTEHTAFPWKCQGLRATAACAWAKAGQRLGTRTALTVPVPQVVINVVALNGLLTFGAAVAVIGDALKRSQQAAQVGKG